MALHEVRRVQTARLEAHDGGRPQSALPCPARPVLGDEGRHEREDQREQPEAVRREPAEQVAVTERAAGAFGTPYQTESWPWLRGVERGVDEDDGQDAETEDHSGVVEDTPDSFVLSVEEDEGHPCTHSSQVRGSLLRSPRKPGHRWPIEAGRGS